MPDRPVLFVTGEYPPDHGGIADYTARLREALAQRSVKTTVLTHSRRGDGAARDALRLVRRWDRRALLLLARVAPRDAVVHVQYQAAAFDLLGAISLAPLVLRLARPDVRSVATFHDVRWPYLFPGARPLRPAALRLLAQTSRAVLAADPADLRWLRVAPGRGHLVPIGSNVPCRPPAGYARAAFRAAHGFGPEHVVVAYFGFLNQSKGLATLAQAFSRVVEQSPAPASLLVLGGAAGASDATDRQTARVFQGLLGPLMTHVRLTGYLPPADLSAWLLAADLALLPYEDGASARRGSLLACAAHGLPIVTTRGAGLTTFPSGAVLACPPGDAAALASAILSVARSAEIRTSLLQGSQRIAAATSWPTIALHHHLLYAALG